MPLGPTEVPPEYERRLKQYQAAVRGAATGMGAPKARVSPVTPVTSSHATASGSIVVCATRYGRCARACAAAAVISTCVLLLGCCFCAVRCVSATAARAAADACRVWLDGEYKVSEVMALPSELDGDQQSTLLGLLEQKMAVSSAQLEVVSNVGGLVHVPAMP